MSLILAFESSGVLITVDATSSGSTAAASLLARAAAVADPESAGSAADGLALAVAVALGDALGGDGASAALLTLEGELAVNAQSAGGTCEASIEVEGAGAEVEPVQGGISSGLPWNLPTEEEPERAAVRCRGLARSSGSRCAARLTTRQRVVMRVRSSGGRAYAFGTATGRPVFMVGRPRHAGGRVAAFCTVEEPPEAELALALGFDAGVLEEVLR